MAKNNISNVKSKLQTSNFKFQIAYFQCQLLNILNKTTISRLIDNWSITKLLPLVFHISTFKLCQILNFKQKFLNLKTACVYKQQSCRFVGSKIRVHFVHSPFVTKYTCSPDMRKVEILPQADFRGLKISSK